MAVLAVALDRVAGPGAPGRTGVLARDLTVGVLGSLTVAALTSVVLRQDIGEGLPIPRRIAPAALLFAALAGELFTTGSGRSPPGW